jgi:dTDP-4-dehydrorhamnose reductase
VSKTSGTAGGTETIETISAAAEAAPQARQQQQVQLQIDDANTPITYSTTVRVSSTAEEFNIDFAGPLRQTSPTAARLKVDQRVVLNPWAAKRLAMALIQAVQRYEQTYGVIELDAKKRLVNQPASGGRK